MTAATVVHVGRMHQKHGLGIGSAGLAEKVRRQIVARQGLEVVERARGLVVAGLTEMIWQGRQAR